jgi:hypothetical protein
MVIPVVLMPFVFHHYPIIINVFSWLPKCNKSGVMINALPSLNQGLAPVSGNAASNAKSPSTSQPAADSADSFISQFLASMGQQGSKPGSSQNNNSDSLMSMLDASNTSVPNASMYSMPPASLYSAEL